MNTKPKILLAGVLSIALILFSTYPAFGNEYKALEDVKSVKAVYDFRIGNPNVAVIHLDLIHKTFTDPNLTINSAKPEGVIIFMGPAVKMVSTARDGFTPEEQKKLDAIAEIVSKLAKDGVRLEICMAAVDIVGVDRNSILPEIVKVPNGWISAIGYQSKGYALISDF